MISGKGTWREAFSPAQVDKKSMKAYKDIMGMSNDIVFRIDRFSSR